MYYKIIINMSFIKFNHFIIIFIKIVSFKILKIIEQKPKYYIIKIMKSLNSFGYNFFNHSGINKATINIFQSINSSKNLIKIIITLYLKSSAEILS